MGRLIHNFNIGDLVVHKIVKDEGFELGVVIGYDWEAVCVRVHWAGGRKVYHIPEMLKHLRETT